jgi:hypothetical protein
MRLKTKFIDSLLPLHDAVAALQRPTGQFANDTGYTIYNQYAGIYFALLYTHDDPSNPFHKDPDTLRRAIAGWEFYRTQINEAGKARIVTFDQYWYDNADEWGCYYWINTLELLRPHLDPALARQWDQCIDRIVHKAIRDYIDRTLADAASMKNLDEGSVANHFIWHILCFYRYGMTRNRPEMCDEARSIMERICRTLPSHGAWFEHGQPVVKYAEVAACAVSLFELFDNNAQAADTIRKSLDFVLATSYPDLSHNAAVDCRNHYSPGRVAYTAPTFCKSEPGRAYLTRWIDQVTRRQEPGASIAYKLQGLAVVTDLAVHLPPDAPCSDANPMTFVPDQTRWNQLNTAITRRHGWTVTLSGSPAKPSNSRWVLERQNLLEIFHAPVSRGTGLQPVISNSSEPSPIPPALLVGGGHSIAHPHFSCFNIIAEGKVHYLHSDSRLNDTGLSLSLKYGPRWCHLHVEDLADGKLQLRYEVEDLTDLERALVHIPLWPTPATIQNPNSPIQNRASLPANHPFPFSSAQFTLSEPAEYTFPHHPFNPYLQQQKAESTPPHALLTIPLDKSRPTLRLTIARS